MLNQFAARRFDDVPDENWDPKDAALWAAKQILTHEQICAERWGVLVKLMWWVLSGIGLILVDLVKDYIGFIVEAVQKAHG